MVEWMDGWKDEWIIDKKRWRIRKGSFTPG